MFTNCQPGEKKCDEHVINSGMTHAIIAGFSAQIIAFLGLKASSIFNFILLSFEILQSLFYRLTNVGEFETYILLLTQDFIFSGRQVSASSMKRRRQTVFLHRFSTNYGRILNTPHTYCVPQSLALNEDESTRRSMWKLKPTL